MNVSDIRRSSSAMLAWPAVGEVRLDWTSPAASRSAAMPSSEFSRGVDIIGVVYSLRLERDSFLAQYCKLEKRLRYRTQGTYIYQLLTETVVVYGSNQNRSITDVDRMRNLTEI